MSKYQFFASDKPLEEFDNNIIFFDSNKQVLRVEKNRLSSYNEGKAMRINIEDDMKHMRLYTPKKYCTYIEWNYSDENAKVVIEYIKRHLSGSREIELWNVWLGDKEGSTKKTCSIDDLDKNDIKSIWGKDYFEFPECLKIFRHTKDTLDHTKFAPNHHS